MSLKRKWTGVIEWIVAVILLITTLYFYFFSYGSFSAISAFKASERTYNYGPSDIIRVIDVKNGKVFLGRYKDWFSATAVKKGFIKWYPGGGVGGHPINLEERISHTWRGTSTGDKTFAYMVFGYVTDPKICTVTFEVEENGEVKTLSQSIDSDKMFTFMWDKNEHNYNFVRLNGLDASGNSLYEHKYP